MKYLRRIIIWLSSLKVAIVLIILIAIGSSIGTAVPQNEPVSTYITNYQSNQLFGFLNGELLLMLQFDHVYSSIWFLILLALLSLSLIICSWRRQWPNLKKAMLFIDYKDSKQIQKLAISQTVDIKRSSNEIHKLEKYLTNNGWQVQNNSSRLSARKGLIGRVGPPLVHFGLILLIFGATLGVL